MTIYAEAFVSMNSTWSSSVISTVMPAASAALALRFVIA